MNKTHYHTHTHTSCEHTHTHTHSNLLTNYPWENQSFGNRFDYHHSSSLSYALQFENPWNQTIVVSKILQGRSQQSIRRQQQVHLLQQRWWPMSCPNSNCHHWRWMRTIPSPNSIHWQSQRQVHRFAGNWRWHLSKHRSLHRRWSTCVRVSCRSMA